MLAAMSRMHTFWGRTAALSRLMQVARLEVGIKPVDTFEYKLGRGFGSCDGTRRSISYKRRAKEEANNDGGNNVSESKKLPLKEKLKVVWKRYGLVAIGTYSCVYFTTLGVNFCIFDFGFLTASDLPTAIIERIPDSDYMAKLPDWLHGILDTLEENPRMKTMGLAWATTELLEPLRILATIFLAPYIARAIGRAPPKST